MVHLDLTTDKSKFKALIYSTPTVADLDADGRMEVIFGTSLGLLYVLDGESGFVRRFFPMQFHEIQSQVAVADVAGDMDLELIFGDMGGNVLCVSGSGDILWDAKVSGGVSQTPTIGDVDGDGDLDVVVTATYYAKDGTRGCHIWAFDGATGAVLRQFPMALPQGSVAVASVLLVDLHDYSAPTTDSDNEMPDPELKSLIEMLKNDSEVMKSAEEKVKSAAKLDRQLKKTKSKGKSARRAILRSVTDPAVPPWVQSSFGHEAPPTPSLQTTSLILGSDKKFSSNVRGNPKNDVDVSERDIIQALELVIRKPEAEEKNENYLGNNSFTAFIKSRQEQVRREKETELLKHIRYRSDSGSLGLHLVVAAGDGHVYIIDGAKGCAERIDVGEHVFSMPLIDDISQDGFLDLVIGTANGQILVLETEIPYHPLNAWSSFPKYRTNGFTHGISGISIPSQIKKQLLYSDTFHRDRGGSTVGSYDVNEDGNILKVTFDIWDARGALHDPKVQRFYDVSFTMGMNKMSPLYKNRFTSPGRYTVNVPVHPPDSFLLVLGMTNEHGQYFEDAVHVSLCSRFYVWIKYVIIIPIMIFSVSLFFMKGSA